MLSRSILATAISLVLITQTHAAGTATSEQIGNSNLTEITQQASQNVSAAMLQDGDSNLAFVAQKGAELTIQTTQRGTGNLLDIRQDGWESTAEITQNGQINVATVYQRPFDNAQLSAIVDQHGQGNEATIQQLDANVSYARTTQDGINNFVEVQQIGPMSSISVKQIGESNDVSAHQTASGADILQTGNNNNVELDQYSDSYAQTIVEQNGSFNDANVNQSSGGRYPGGTVDLYQQGERNEAQAQAGLGPMSTSIR